MSSVQLKLTLTDDMQGLTISCFFIFFFKDQHQRRFHMLSEIQAAHSSSHERGVRNGSHFSGLFLHLDHYKEGQGDSLEMVAMPMSLIHSPFKMSHEPREWLPHS